MADSEAAGGGVCYLDSWPTGRSDGSWEPARPPTSVFADNREIPVSPALEPGEGLLLTQAGMTVTPPSLGCSSSASLEDSGPC